MSHVRYVSDYIDIEAVQKLFKEYAQIKGTEMCFASFETELNHIKQIYLNKNSNIFLAYVEENPIGCVAIKQIDHHTCEMKRLYVKPAFRRCGVANHLIESSIQFAKIHGYKILKLETLPEIMENAIKLYRRFGFKDLFENEGLLTMECLL